MTEHDTPEPSNRRTKEQLEVVRWLRIMEQELHKPENNIQAALDKSVKRMQKDDTDLN